MQSKINSFEADTCSKSEGISHVPRKNCTGIAECPIVAVQGSFGELNNYIVVLAELQSAIKEVAQSLDSGSAA